MFGVLLLALSPARAQDYKFQGQFGGTGSGEGQFQDPGGVAIDPTTHNIVVTDCFNNRVQIFDSGGTFLSQFGSSGSGDGQFLCPTAVAIDPTTDEINVVDVRNHRVEVFSSSGTFSSTFGSSGMGPGEFFCTGGIAIDPTTRNKVIVDAESHPGMGAFTRFEIFNSSGVFLSQFSGTFLAENFGCGFGQAAGVAIDPPTHDIIHSDFLFDHIQIFSPAGMLLSQFGTSGSGEGQFDIPTGIAIDPVSDNLVVADSSNNRVQILDLAGVFLSQFGNSQSCNGLLSEPNAVAVDPTTENIVVADSGGVSVGSNKVSIYVPTTVPVLCGPLEAPAVSEASLVALAAMLAMIGMLTLRQRMAGLRA